MLVLIFFRKFVYLICFDKMESIDFLTKNKLIEIGFNEFGIPKSKLKSLKKQHVIDSIKAAIDHNLSLDIITKQAKIAGENRNN